jgi:hypothetical protein
MRLAAIAPLFCAVAFGQSAPPVGLLDKLNPSQADRLKQHLKTLKLTPLHSPTVVVVRRNPGVCAVPLLQALPPNDKTDYKLRVFRPTMPPEQPQAKIVPPCN